MTDTINNLNEAATATPATPVDGVTDDWFHTPLHSGSDFFVFNKPTGRAVLADRQSPQCLWE